MKLNISFGKFKRLHKNKHNQTFVYSKRCKNYSFVENLYKFILAKKNSFIFESVEKGVVRGRYTIIGFNPDKSYNIKGNRIIEDDFKTDTEGLSEILKDGSMLVEEQNHGRLIFFNNNGEKEWEYVNKDSKGNIYFISWSRIIEEKNLLTKIKESINNKKCIN